MKILLRPWRAEDIASVARYANNPHIAANLRDVFPSPYTLEDAQWFVHDCMEKGDAAGLNRAVVVDGEAIGSVSVLLQADVYRKSAELGYWLAEPFWNRGIMRVAVGMICAQAFERYDIVRIFAEPFAHNTASRKVLEGCGFSLEGMKKNSVYKNGCYADSCMYALLREQL